MIDRTVLGIDVGGTKLAGVVTTADGSEVTRSVPRDGAVDRQVEELVRDLLHAAESPPSAVGIAAPGRVDASSGVVDLAVNLGAGRIPLAAAVERSSGLPVHIEHDARAVARLLAAESSVADLAYLSVGTGISAGVILGGRPLSGALGLAGEVGHQLADPRGPRCGCGLVGCLEAIASGPAIARAAAGAAPANGDRASTTAEVYRRADGGDADAVALVERAARHLAAAIRGLVLGFGVTRVVVGGGVTHAGAPFEVPLRRFLAEERAASDLVDGALAATTVDILAADPFVGARAAALVAREGRIGLPGPAPSPGEEVGHR